MVLLDNSGGLLWVYPVGVLNTLGLLYTKGEENRDSKYICIYEFGMFKVVNVVLFVCLVSMPIGAGAGAGVHPQEG